MKWYQSLVQSMPFSLPCSVLGFVGGALYFPESMQAVSWDTWLPVAIFLGSMLSGWFVWWLVVLRKKCYSVKRGFWAGMLNGVLVHPFAWCLCFLGMACKDIVQGNADDPLEMLMKSLILSAVAGSGTLITMGLVTLPTSIVAGMHVVQRQEPPQIDEIGLGES